VSFIESYNLKNASYIVVVSDALKKTLVGFGVDKSKIIVNPNGIDEEKYHPNVEYGDIKQKYSLQNKVVLGFIGTFGQWHGAENIALAYGKLLQKYPEYKEKSKLLMIGDGIKIGEVKKHITDFEIQTNVVLTGLVPQSEGSKYLSACDVLINSTVPNPDGSEFFGSPTKLFEYMAMGKAIICSDMAQMAEILIHNKTAYMVKPADIDELMNAMKILIDDEKIREVLSKNAREEAVAKYTWDKHVENILEKINE
jgi:glycosyltransferase involved in cell wall biosynthesis